MEKTREQELQDQLDAYKDVVEEAGSTLALLEQNRDAHRGCLERLVNVLSQQSYTLTDDIRKEWKHAQRFLAHTDEYVPARTQKV